MANEQKNLEINKHLKTQAELYFTLKAKNCDYRAVECPIVYNFYSSGDYTCFLNYNGRTGLYDLYASANFAEMFIEYMPLNYGSKYDKLCNGEYPEMRKMFIEICKWEMEYVGLQIRSIDELRKSLKNTD